MKKNTNEGIQGTSKVSMVNWSNAKLMEMVNSESLDLNYSIQRNSVYTNNDRKSIIAVIEKNKLCGLMHVSLHADGKYYSIDGKQRAITVKMAIADEVEFADGKKFSELEPAKQAEFLAYSFPIIIYEGISEDEEVMLFESVNGKFGKKLSPAEMIKNHTPAELKALSDSAFWACTKLSTNAKNRFEDLEILIQSAMMIQSDEARIDLVSDSQGEFIPAITSQTIEDLKLTFEYLATSIVGKEEFFKKVNIPIIARLANEARKQNHTAIHFAGFLQEFFIACKWKTLHDSYSTACSSGTSKASAVNTRYSSLASAYKKVKPDTLCYKLSEQKKLAMLKAQTKEQKEKVQAKTLTNKEKQEIEDLANKIEQGTNQTANQAQTAQTA